MNPSPFPPSPPCPFTVIIATSSESHTEEIYKEAVNVALEGTPFRAVVSNARSIRDLVEIPEFSRAALVLVAISNLQGDGHPEKKRGSLDWSPWMESRVRLMRQKTSAHIMCLSGLDKLEAFRGMERGGAHTVMQVPVLIRELAPEIAGIHARWMIGLRFTPSALVDASVARPILPRSRTILVGQDQFGELVEAVIRERLAGMCDIRCVRFQTEDELRALVATCAADLIFLYLSNNRWNPLAPATSQELASGKRQSTYAGWLQVLGEISTTYRVPVIASQGMDLRADAARVGVHFLEAPFTLANLLPVIHTALGIPQPPDLPKG